MFGNFVDNEIEAEDQDFGQSVWKVLLWPFWFAYLGIWPTVDHNNKAYPPGTPEAEKAGIHWLGATSWSFGA